MQTKNPRISELEKTLAEHKRTVYGIALTRLQNKHEAEDVMQEVFLLYFRKNLSFDSENKKRAWLINTTINKCRQFNMGRWNTNVDKSKELDISAVAELETERDREIYTAVSALPVKERDAVYLHYFLGLSVGETASALGIRANAVSMRISRAKKLLRKRLEAEIL